MDAASIVAICSAITALVAVVVTGVIKIITVWRLPVVVAEAVKPAVVDAVTPVAERLEVVHELVNSQKAALVAEVQRLNDLLSARVDFDKPLPQVPHP